MIEKITTIEELAVMINRGFDTLATKEDLKSFATKEEINKRFDEVDNRLDYLDARVGRIEADIYELRDEVVYRHEFEDVLRRIEKKIGIESGV